MKIKKKKSFVKEKSGLTVHVMYDDVERAIKKMRRIVKQNGVMQAFYNHRYYIKPSIKRAKKRSWAKFKAQLWTKQQLEKIKQS